MQAIVSRDRREINIRAMLGVGWLGGRLGGWVAGWLGEFCESRDGTLISQCIPHGSTVVKG